MPSGPDLATLWFLGSAAACLLILLWLVLAGLVTEGYRAASLGLLGLVAAIAAFPALLSRFAVPGLPTGPALLIGATLLLAAALAVLVRMRRDAALFSRATFGIAAVLNLWLTLILLLGPLRLL